MKDLELHFAYEELQIELESFIYKMNMGVRDAVSGEVKRRMSMAYSKLLLIQQDFTDDSEIFNAIDSLYQEKRNK